MSLISQFDGFLSTTVHWKSLNTHTTFNYNHLLAHNFAVIKTLFYHAGSLRYTENDYQQNMWSNIKRNGYSVGSYHASEWEKGHQSQSRSDLLKVTVVLLYIQNTSESVQSVLDTVNILICFKPHGTLSQECRRGVVYSIRKSLQLMYSAGEETGQMLDLYMGSTSQP